MNAFAGLRRRLVMPDADIVDIDIWRATILARLLLGVFIMGGVTGVPSMLAAAAEGRYQVVVIDILALAWVAFLATRRHMALRLRVLGLVATVYLLGLFFLHAVGGVAQIYLMAVPTLTALFLGLRPGLWALVLNAVTMMVATYTGFADLHVGGPARASWLQALVVTLNLTFVSAIITISIAALLQGLERALARQRNLAHFDPLTGLPNRRLLQDRMAALLSGAQRNGRHGAVVFIDLDHFKNVNDARGHAVGDDYLRQVTQRLKEFTRADDTVARLGGDEFVILLGGLEDAASKAAERALHLAERLRVALAQPFALEGKPYSAGASLGVTLLSGARSVDDLLREADTAMYRAKSAGRNRVAFFEAAMQVEVEQRMALEADLAGALAGGQLHMMMQPQFTPDGRPCGAELLMRWTHPVRGPVSPVQFIPVAEQTGMILALGDWVLHEGCATALRLKAAGYDIPVSINVSPRQFRQPDFVAQVKEALAQSGAQGSQLIFEVTEGLLIDSLDDTVRRMEELARLGIRFSIDDFGTGYSSMAYLKRLPLFELKIDRSFVRDVPDDPSDTAIVELILSMARVLGLRTVAEGVETQAQAEFLARTDCTALQGYLFARPQPVEQWLAAMAKAPGA